MVVHHLSNSQWEDWSEVDLEWHRRVLSPGLYNKIYMHIMAKREEVAPTELDTDDSDYEYILKDMLGIDGADSTTTPSPKIVGAKGVLASPRLGGDSALNLTTPSPKIVGAGSETVDGADSTPSPKIVGAGADDPGDAERPRKTGRTRLHMYTQQLPCATIIDPHAAPFGPARATH